MLSGIQHFMFCPRQWALIHIEQQWAENKLTTEGSILHSNVDNPFYRQKNGDVITLRSLHIASRELGLYGVTMRWNLFLPTPERIRSPIINTKDFGSLILLNIKGDIVNLMRETKYNWRLKFYVWKKCMVFIFLVEPSITMR